MKKVILMSGLAILLMASCKKNEAPMPPPPPVENPAPPVKPEPQVPVAPVTTPPPAPEQKDGTSVSVDGNGVSVQNKNGDKANNVTISKDKKSVQIQTQH